MFFLKLVEQEEIVGFVVGLPIHSDGRNSEMSSEVEKFATWLSDVTERPIVFQDERHTSQEASGLLRPARLTRGRKKERHDAVAAQSFSAHGWKDSDTTKLFVSYRTKQLL
ncbi:unnamed protein product, partial [marine sediment metagenome]